MIEHKNIKIKKSNSKLGFATTGGGSWKVWDRFLTYNGEQLFHIGNVCGTCNFFFNKKEIKLNRSYDTNDIRDLLNNGIAKLENIDSLKSIFPKGEYVVIKTEITPRLTFPNDKNDYFITDLFESWRDENDGKSEVNQEYYRGLSIKIKESEMLFEFFIPTYKTSDLNESRITEYMDLIQDGFKPTVLALGVLDVKNSMTYPVIDGEEIEPEIDTHWCFANYLIDGHHKIMAANRLGKSISMISFISKEQSWKLIDELIDIYEITPANNV